MVSHRALRDVPTTPAGFLTGITVLDPVDGMTLRTFNDLARRQAVLANIVGTPCRLTPLLDLFFDPTRSTE